MRNERIWKNGAALVRIVRVSIDGLSVRLLVRGTSFLEEDSLFNIQILLITLLCIYECTVGYICWLNK